MSFPTNLSATGLEMSRLRVNGARLLDRHHAMASHGATGNGGVVRPALSAEETAARRTLLDWARERRFACAMDPIGNLFIRRPGSDEALAPVRIGSHLDSQMPGGNYDGVYGVLAAFEVLETIDDHGLVTKFPLEVVVWNNEEGCRFPPTTMGSAVHAGELSIDTALETTDVNGVSVRSALEASIRNLGKLQHIPLGTPTALYLEAHIEQGPVLEAGGLALGVVTDIQGVAQFRVTVKGELAHAGTTPKYLRKDALRYAMQLIDELSARVERYDDRVRFTVGSLRVFPDAINTVPGEVTFSIDLRHPDRSVLKELCELIVKVSTAQDSQFVASVVQILDSPPVRFDSDIVSTIRQIASSMAESTDIISGATHDAKLLASTCPTGMIFIPCYRGISHNEDEYAEPSHMIVGADALLASVLRFAAPSARDTAH